MPTPDKEKLIEDLSQKLAGNKMTVLTDYTGINVQAITKLRDEFRKASIEYRIFKNTLARIAANKTGFESLLEFMDGPTGYVFSEEPTAPAKILVDFIKSNPNMKIKCATLEGRLLDEAQFKAIAALPPREVLLAQLLGQMMAPLSGLATVLNGPIRKLVYALDDLRKQKEAA
jgi:large subunit ribosomal protein L10